MSPAATVEGADREHSLTGGPAFRRVKKRGLATAAGRVVANGGDATGRLHRSRPGPWHQRRLWTAGLLLRHPAQRPWPCRGAICHRPEFPATRHRPKLSATYPAPPDVLSRAHAPAGAAERGWPHHSRTPPQFMPQLLPTPATRIAAATEPYRAAGARGPGGLTSP